MRTTTKSKNSSSSRTKTNKKASASSPVVLDAQSLQNFLAAFADQTDGGTSLEEAQEIVYQAWDSPQKRARIALAQKALRISPLCADAYVLLAQEAAKNFEEARDLYAKGVDAGEKAIGPKDFRELKGEFWGFLETRPYMRARLGLAETLWELGDVNGALGHYRDLLKLNPNDNQGVRYILASRYLNSDKDDDLKKLLTSYIEDSSALWLYTRALIAFRARDKAADGIAEDAWRSNKHVPAMLAGPKRLDSIQEWLSHGGRGRRGHRICGRVW
jgi:tetratricopeptide (TPR) repeat protein